MAGVANKVPELIGALMNQAKPRVAMFMRHAKVELTPPTPADIPKAVTSLRNVFGSFKSGAYKELTVKQAWLNTLVTMEVFFWFYVGEVIGKRHLRGYKV